MMKKVTVILVAIALVAVAQASVVSVFTGGDAGEGLDLSGTMVYALNVANGAYGAGADVTVVDTTFVDDYPAPAGVSSWYAMLTDWGAKPDYGTSINDNNLEEVMYDMAIPLGGRHSVEMNVVAGMRYKLQAILSENWYGVQDMSNSREQDLVLYDGAYVDQFGTGRTVFDTASNVNVRQFVESNSYTTSTAGVVVTMEFTATSSGLVTLVCSSPALPTSGLDPTPILSAVTLEATKVAKNLTPRNGETFVSVDTQLTWEAPDAYVPTGYDVWIGTTEPNSTDPYADMTKILDKQNVTSVDPGILANGTVYYWRVNCYEPNSLGDRDILNNGLWLNFTTLPAVPVINGQPVSQLAENGGTIEFTVTAINADTYYWYKVGTPDQLIETHSNSSGTDTLTLTAVNQGSDEGLYYCVAESIVGSDVSNLAELRFKQLIGYWKFDDPENSTVATDYSGFGNDGLIVGDPNDMVGDPDASVSLNFDGHDDYVDIPLAALDPLVNQISIVLWQYGANQGNSIFHAESQSNENPNAAALDCHLPWADNVVYWDAPYDLDGVTNRISKAATLAEYNGVWHQWAFIKDAATGEMDIYLDGKLWHSGSGNFDETFTENLANFSIGAKLSTATATSQMNYSGKIKEFKVFNYALDTEGVAQLYYNDTGISPCVNSPVYDISNDCKVDLADLALLASEWLKCGRYPYCD